MYTVNKHNYIINEDNNIIGIPYDYGTIKEEQVDQDLLTFDVEFQGEGYEELQW